MVLTDTVVGLWVDVVTTGTVVVSTDETVVPVTVVDSTEVGGCVTTLRCSTLSLCSTTV